jgi:hypothetical protein
MAGEYAGTLGAPIARGAEELLIANHLSNTPFAGTIEAAGEFMKVTAQAAGGTLDGPLSGNSSGEGTPHGSGCVVRAVVDRRVRCRRSR